MRRNNFIVAVALLCVAQFAYGTTYYIDSKRGKDSWSGTLVAPAGSPSGDGPWQTLKRLARASLMPGDIIELQCGSKWIETLRLNSSGSLDHPIIIRPSSSTCAAKPTIDGGYTIEAREWVHDNNEIYKVSWPPQKIQDPTFRSGSDAWTSWSKPMDQKLAHETTCPGSSRDCTSFKSSMNSTGSIAISNNFHLDSGVAYSGGLSLLIPSGIKVKVLVRRGSPPWDAISGVQWLTGTNTWQRIGFAFSANQTVADARLDIEVPTDGVKIYFNNASLKPALARPLGAWMSELPLLPAHHPNRGHDPRHPGSVYAITPTDANAVVTNGRTGSTYIETDSSLSLPAGAAPKPGDRLRIRSVPWHIDEVTITEVEGSRINFKPATMHRITAGQGYFLLGGYELLDSSGEWFYDNTAVYLATGGTISNSQAKLSLLEKGVDLSRRSNIVIEGLDIRHTVLGIDLNKADNITVRSVQISNTVGEGISANPASDIHIMSNRIYRTGRDAISCQTANNIYVEDNNITESAISVTADGIWSLPAPTFGAIMAGRSATITSNHIKHAASNGIWPLANGVVERNAILDVCQQTNDCGGIYVNHASPNTRIAFNLVEGVSGNLSGLPANTRTHAVGIYLDDLSTGMHVEGNTAAKADYGIQVHNSHGNQILKNLLHGNRNAQLWLLERTKKSAASGDVYNNTITENRFFPAASAAAVVIESELDSLTNFGLLSGNYYSALFSARVVNESWPTHNLSYTLAEWQNALNGEGRQPQDRGSAELLQHGYAAYLIEGVNIVPNGKLAAGMHGWTSWNLTEPFSTRSLQNCTIGPCILMTGGGGTTLLSTPNFSVTSGRSYRVSFDAKTGVDGQFISPVVRRGGPTPLYERLMPRAEGFNGSTEWRRYAFSFTASKTVNAADPKTNELGARLDFEKIFPGQSLWIANVEIVPLVAVENTLRTQLLTNPDRVAQSIECPDLETAPEHCASYRTFPEGAAVSWPVDVPALGSVSIFTINQTARDSDGDGIADSQDKCTQTSINTEVDASGCALTQTSG